MFSRWHENLEDCSVFKAGDKSSLSNYRPISVLLQFSIILEKFFYSRALKCPSSRIWHLAVVTRLERVEDDSDYTKNVQRYWKGAVRDSRRRPCPTKPFQLALGQRGRDGPPFLS